MAEGQLPDARSTMTWSYRIGHNSPPGLGKWTCTVYRRIAKTPDGRVRQVGYGFGETPDEAIAVAVRKLHWKGYITLHEAQLLIEELNKAEVR